MNALHVVDYAIILLYFILVSGVGFYFRKIAAGSLENYFLGGRRLPWWLLGASGMAHFFDMAGTMLIVSFLYLLGPRGLYIEFRGGAVLTLAFMMCWLGKWHRRSQCMTNAEWMNFRFGKGRDGDAARLLTAISGLIWGVGIIAYLAKGAGLFLSMFIPINPMACALVMLTVATLYTMSAGFFGVVVTDFIQSALIIFAAIYLSVTAFFKVAEPANFASLTEKVTGNASWITTLPSWKTEMPQGYEPYEFLGMFALFYFIRYLINAAMLRMTNAPINNMPTPPNHMPPSIQPEPFIIITSPIFALSWKAKNWTIVMLTLGGSSRGKSRLLRRCSYLYVLTKFFKMRSGISTVSRWQFSMRVSAFEGGK
jgi:SSS family solute:Na+ symporter